MALDSRQKRAAVVGVARIWYRNPHPSNMNGAQRASVASAYPVASFSPVVPSTVDVKNVLLIADCGKLMSL